LGITLFAIAVDCTDAAKLARFWADVLGWQLSEGATPQRAVLVAGNEVAGVPRLTFNQVPEVKVIKNRLHLDLISDSFDTDTERVLRLGAHKLVEQHEGEFSWITFADMEGNEFDLIAG
jgi:predicted enzyme related to lactoylglutathione lyase